MRGLRTCFPPQYSTLDAETLSHLQTHAGLWLDKYLPEQEDQNKKGDRHQNDRTKSSVTNPRMAHIQSVATLTLSPDHPYRAFYKRWEALLSEDDKARMRLATVKGRMIVGLGDESVLETSVALHQTYGIPYIPGSALKGLAASYIHQYAARTDDANWQKESEAYKILFGDTNDAGYITFFDAFYVPDTGPNKQALWPDIITVHHQKYYQGSNGISAPADWDSPIPIAFLSATGTFLIALAAPDLQEPAPWLDKTFDILREALLELGIGAKTSSGYGRMDLSSIDHGSPELKKAQGIKREMDGLPDNAKITGQIDSFYQRWQRLQSQRGRILVAKAIIEKVHKAGLGKTAAEKPWYKELVAFLHAN
jgi:CRISPR-associated protein Cmr6